MSKMKCAKAAFFYSVAMLLSVVVFGGDINIKVSKRYLNFPVSQKATRDSMFLVVNGKIENGFVIRLTTEPEYWVFRDVSRYMGQQITLTFKGDAAGLKMIYQDDKIPGSDSIYKETNRPQLHFTTRIGWTNDPNGLIYHNNEYHLFYQHNPYEREWQNMHWGHAVSKDLITWSELPTALYPDQHGNVFSGTAVFDKDNTSGFGKNNNPPLVAIYTADNPDRQVQCLAYSLDNGRTWTKYQGNPVINSKEKWQTTDTRDPKVFWHQPTKKWVMVLNERDGHSIYNSDNLKSWTFESHINGFWECPELFELPVDGNKNNKLWVMYGASGSYMLGKFDGKSFSPVTGKLSNSFGLIYAAQTYNNIPESDGRRIQFGWDVVSHPGMPFKGQMSLPAELTLRNTPNGARLFTNPIRELDKLQGENLIAEKGISIKQAEELLNKYSEAGTLRIKITMKYSHSLAGGLKLFGQDIVNYDFNRNTINEHFYSPGDFSKMEISADIIIDKTSIQVYLDNGGMSYCLQRQPQAGSKKGFEFWEQKPITIESLEVFPMKSIWK